MNLNTETANNTSVIQHREQIMPFNFGEHEIRVIQDEHGDPWFIASEIAKILGYRDATNMCRMLDGDEKGTHIMSTLGGNQELSMINESGLYSCILKSRKEEAKPFQKWVTRDVLPSIRKHGMYAKDELLDNPDVFLEVVTKLKEERDQRLLAEQQRDHAIATKAQISDKKTASAMNTASQEKKRANKLEKQLAESKAELDESKEFASIKRMEARHGGKYKWRELKKYSNENGLPINDIFDANYGTVKTYHRDAWQAVYGLTV